MSDFPMFDLMSDFVSDFMVAKTVNDVFSS